jgi:methionyl-tRNA formyltransferase
MKFAYCGHDFFHNCLEALLRDGHEIVELFSFPTDNKYSFNEKVFSVARTRDIRISMSKILMEDIERVRAKGADLIISAAYLYKIPDWRGLLSYGINVHPAALPEGRGPWPLPWVILKELRATGVTVHELTDRWDAGDILNQTVLDVPDRETLDSLSLRVQMAAADCLTTVVNNIEHSWKNKRQQVDGTYWQMLGNQDRTISWDMPIEKIDRIVRAFSKFDAFVFIDNVRYFVQRVDVWKEEHRLPIGSVAFRGSREVVYAARDGFVALTSYARADED